MAEISSVNMAKFRYLSGVFVGLFWWYRGVLSAPILQFPFILQDSKSSSLASFLFHHLIVKEYFSISFHFFSFTKSYVSKTALLNHVCPFKLCSLWSPLPVVRALICLNMIFRPFRPTGIPLLSFMQFISICPLSTKPRTEVELGQTYENTCWDLVIFLILFSSKIQNSLT